MRPEAGKGLVNFKTNLSEHRFHSCFPAYRLLTPACASPPSNQAPVPRFPRAFRTVPSGGRGTREPGLRVQPNAPRRFPDVGHFCVFRRGVEVRIRKQGNLEDNPRRRRGTPPSIDPGRCGRRRLRKDDDCLRCGRAGCPRASAGAWGGKRLRPQWECIPAQPPTSFLSRPSAFRKHRR